MSIDVSVPQEASATCLLRDLRPEDREPLRSLLERTGVFSSEEIGIALELIDVVLTRPDQKDYLITVHESDAMADGYYCIGPTPATVGTFDLYWIAVDPGAQGMGIGTLLTRNAEQRIRSMGGSLIIVETSSRDTYAPTRRFYERQAYEELARIRDYYKKDDDLVVFGKYVHQISKGG